ncbi:hypothetical protein HY967_01010 [Candidatus Jorgensenbacteria bacterium]|nr:hypothetical protein [Candidatus Jorgensenbacteria bacterium]
MVLNEFFAVTKTSVYRVTADGGDGLPMVLKIAVKGKSDIPVGHELIKAAMVAICKILITYVPEAGELDTPVYERRIERVDRKWYGGWTSPIIALFKTQKEALDCFKREDGCSCDKRWIAETKSVIEAIGDKHPVFYVCRKSGICLDIFEKTKV